MKLIYTIISTLLLSVLSFQFTFSQITASWTNTGPINFPPDISGQINGIGRVSQLKFHPTNSQIMFAASASGGLYKSNDNGTTWAQTGTDKLPYGLSTASVCIDFTNDQVLYLGTGDANYYGSRDYGIWKSTDGGTSWTPSCAGIGNRVALEILMNPADHNVLLAATDDGIWKSTNAGVSWTLKSVSDQFTDMDFKLGTNGQTIYAASYNYFYRSQDGGETWSKISNGLYFPGGGTTGDGCRIAVTPADANVIYFGMIANRGTIFKSTDGGSSFTVVKDNFNQSLVGYDAASDGQGNYNFDMTVDPNNASTVYIAAHVVWKSTNGGTTWTQLTNWWETVHTDMHQIVFNPYNATQLWNANDGGVWLSTTSGTTWSPKSDGLAATECYSGATSPVAKDLIAIGTQDNGELKHQGVQWSTTRGGDWGSAMTFDYRNPSWVYYHENARRRNLSVNNSEVGMNFPKSSLQDIAFFRSMTSLAFGGNMDVYRTTNLTASSPAWTKISSFNKTIKAMCVSAADSNIVYAVTTDATIYRSVDALATSPSFTAFTLPSVTSNRADVCGYRANANVVYASCGSKMFRSSDKGATWTDITYGLPGVNIYDIITDDYNLAQETVFISSAVGIYYWHPGMTRWILFTQGFPTIAEITDMGIFNDGTSNSVLRIATYGRGVWETSIQSTRSLNAEFTVSNQYPCPGGSVQFTDLSSGIPTSWSWTFTGGTPATSNAQNPTVTYAAAGSYNVTLVATNASGSKSLTKTAFINSAASLLPLTEGFESFTFPPAQWSLLDATANGINWKPSFGNGGFASSSGCMQFDNWDNDETGHNDEIHTKQLNFSGVTGATLKFDVAYQVYSPGYEDSLAVLVSTNCGTTWTKVYQKGGTTLATAGSSTNKFTSPLATQWRTDSVILNTYAGNGDVLISFRNIAHYGQPLYIDNIRVTGTAASCTDNYEPNNTGNTAVSIPLGADLKGIISNSTDFDWFKFNNTAAQPNIKITLNNLPADYNLGLSKGAVLATSKKSGTTQETIIWNTATTGTYKVKVFGKNGAFNASQCYTLRVDLSSTPWTSKVGEETIDQTVDVMESDLQVFPIPAGDVVNVRYSGDEEIKGELRIINLLGQLVYSSTVDLNSGQSFLVDVAQFAAGQYLLSIVTPDGNWKVERISIQH
jgi:PKD repeat protein